MDKDIPEVKQLNPKHAAYMAMINNGLTHAEACKELGYNTTYMYQVRKRNGLTKYDLRNLEGKAFRTVRKLVEGEPVGKIQQVKDSTALAAAAMIMDRSQPKQSDTPTAVTNFIQVNLSVSPNAEQSAIYNDAIDAIPVDSEPITVQISYDNQQVNEE